MLQTSLVSVPPQTCTEENIYSKNNEKLKFGKFNIMYENL